MRGSFSKAKYEVRAKALLDWHASLENDRGGRARLRRAASPEEVFFEPAYHRLLAKLGVAQPVLWMGDPKRRRQIAALAGLAARVHEHLGDSSFARQMGAGERKGSGGAAVSEARFRRLLTATDLDDRYFQLSRVIRLLRNRVDLLSLADALYDWDEDPDLRQQWAYDYYDALS